MGATVHEFTTVHPDRELPAPLVQTKFFAAFGHLRTVEQLPGHHCRFFEKLIFFDIRTTSPQNLPV
jgi:hypothetical protein